MKDDKKGYETLSECVAFDGAIFSVAVEELRLPDGTVVEREVVRHPGAVGVVALSGGDVILVEQYRQAVRRSLLEIPAGKLDRGEDPEGCARRELVEETGFVPRELTKLGDYFSSPGFSDERFHMFMALEPTPGDATPDDHEEQHLRVVKVPFEQAVEDALSGRIEDGKTLTGLLMARAHLDSCVAR